MGMAPVLRTTLLLVLLCVYVNGYIPRFLFGRPRGGFLGSPAIDHLSLAKQKLIKSKVPADQWFDQKLDHFDPPDTRRWQQRYFTSCAVKSNILFVMIGGEGTADPIWNVEGAWIGYAKKYGAVCLQLEHRYYGKSHPTKDLSVDNIKYLSSEQALRDLAAFITAKKKEYHAEKVIVFGGSYPGSLAAWVRMKYPYLVNGAVSASAPLLAQVDFKGYLEVVRNSLDTYKVVEGCTDAITIANTAIETSLPTSSGRNKLKTLFRLCNDIDAHEKKDIANLYTTLAGNFMNVVQYNKDNRAFEGAKDANITIDTVCGIMTNKSIGDELERYAYVNNLLLSVYSEKCTDFKYQNMITSLRDASWKGEGARQWTYQTCTEFGWYQSSDSDDQPFKHTFPIEFWTQQCQDIFSPKFNSTFIEKAVEETNINYGARNYTEDRIVFVNGAIDPWHYLSITKSLPQAEAIYIPGTAHCANMYPPSPEDPGPLTAARARIEVLIGQWLRPQQGDLRLSGPPSGQGTGGRVQTRDRMVPADLRADSLATVPLTPPNIAFCPAYIFSRQ
ncbi:thymus-specific serine protease [Plakobranchus ocellatus]|uniref:Thymus-specific serine protease n=1 Tax=Plakobranchus ocellatus TaxID=259542 RepID=A0AAV4BAU8_9GAST|nr:thymus-specific serine protease [Plakobranchus ocellatus]